MIDRIRYGIIGTGMMGREHIANLLITPGAEITALADPHAPSLDAAIAMLREHGREAALFGCGADLVASGLVDAIVLASPNYTHRAELECILNANLPVLAEKPLATTVEDARWILDLVEGRRLLWTAMEYRYAPPAAEFIRQIHAGRIGQLRMISIREHRFPFLDKIGDWNRFSHKTGGTMVEKSCHFFDLMRHILRADPVRVYCSGAMDVNFIEERYDGHRPDMIDNSYTVVDFADGARGMHDLCMFADGAENQEEMTAVGDDARLDLLIPAGEIIYSPRTGFGEPKRPERMAVAVDADALAAGSHNGATFYQHQQFRAAVLGEIAVEVTARDGFWAVAMGAAAEISAREKRVVTMDEFGL